MSNLNKHQELAIWALRYIKNQEAVKDYVQFQKAMGNISESDHDQVRKNPFEYLDQHFSAVDEAIAWIEGRE